MSGGVSIKVVAPPKPEPTPEPTPASVYSSGDRRDPGALEEWKSGAGAWRQPNTGQDRAGKGWG